MATHTDRKRTFEARAETLRRRKLRKDRIRDNRTADRFIRDAAR